MKLPTISAFVRLAGRIHAVIAAAVPTPTRTLGAANERFDTLAPAEMFILPDMGHFLNSGYRGIEEPSLNRDYFGLGSADAMDYPMLECRIPNKQAVRRSALRTVLVEKASGYVKSYLTDLLLVRLEMGPDHAGLAVLNAGIVKRDFLLTEQQTRIPIPCWGTMTALTGRAIRSRCAGISTPHQALGTLPEMNIGCREPSHGVYLKDNGQAEI